MSGIMWLASYPKSGNTWLRAFLINLLADGQDPVAFSDYWHYISSEASGHWYSKKLGRELRAGDMKLISKLRPSVQRDIARSKNGQVFTKTHNSVCKAFGSDQVNMSVSTGAIYILRNPMDVAISFANHAGVSVDDAITTMAQPGTCSVMRSDRAFEFTSDWSSHVKSWMEAPFDQRRVIRYEDMIDSPIEVLGGVAKFLNEPEKIEKAVRFSSFQALKKLEEQTGFDEKPKMAEAFFRQGSKDQWRDILSKEQQARICARHKEQMQQFGYI
jgi:hypothetical protein